MSQYTVCHNCGGEGHYARSCSAPPPQQAAAALQSTPSGAPGYGVPVPARAPASEIADAAVWAARIREHMGWSPGQHEQRWHNEALEQVAASRASRKDDLERLLRAQASPVAAGRV